MDASTVRALLPTVSTVLVVALGAAVARALHAGVPGVVVAAGVLVLLLLAGTAALVRQRATRRPDDLDVEWAAVEAAWRDRSQ